MATEGLSETAKTMHDEVDELIRTVRDESLVF